DDLFSDANVEGARVQVDVGFAEIEEEAAVGELLAVAEAHVGEGAAPGAFSNRRLEAELAVSRVDAGGGPAVPCGHDADEGVATHVAAELEGEPAGARVGVAARGAGALEEATTRRNFGR